MYRCFWVCLRAARYKGSKYCQDCVCVVVDCTRPRYHGQLCRAHAKVFEACCPGLQLTFLSRNSLASSMPSDVVSFVLHAKPWRSDAMMKMLIALWKERGSM